MVFVAYIRVSSIEQNESRQRELIKNNGVPIFKEFLDKFTGRHMNRPGLSEMFNFLREGDTVIVESYSRISRSTRDLLSLIQTFEMKKIHLISIKESFDTTKPHAKLMITVIKALAEFENEVLRERQLEGIALAKAAGKYKGRKKTIERTEITNQFLDRYIFRNCLKPYPLKKLMEDTDLKNNTIHKFIKIRKEEILQQSNQS